MICTPWNVPWGGDWHLFGDRNHFPSDWRPQPLSSTFVWVFMIVLSRRCIIALVAVCVAFLHCVTYCGLLLLLDQVCPVLHQLWQPTLTFWKMSTRVLFDLEASSLPCSTKLPSSSWAPSWSRRNEPLPPELDELLLMSRLRVTIIDTTWLPLDTSLWSHHRFWHDHLDLWLLNMELKIFVKKGEIKMPKSSLGKKIKAQVISYDQSYEKHEWKAMLRLICWNEPKACRWLSDI